WLERNVDIVEVTGSSPVTPTIFFLPMDSHGFAEFPKSQLQQFNLAWFGQMTFRTNSKIFSGNIPQ
ncbi:MAG: hypothetical protein PHO45_05125, partial [Victivallaceae bacterium]|nr:hypothetical protein [Victivallaceae bacterium]